MSDGFLQVVHTWFPPKWAVRTGGPVANLAAQVQAAVSGVDPRLPLAHFAPIDKLQANVTSGQRYHAALFSIVAGLALLLTAIGLYGLISYSVEERKQELGVRIALGATARQAIWNTVRPGLALALAGVATGYGLSRLAMRLLASLLWGVRPTDAPTFVGAAVILLLVASCASLAPALGILHLDPAQTLRKD
jgi:ABC-type antimicrobial peptide transport system permease subunit